MMTTQRTRYDKEFKQKLVELAQAKGNAKQVAEEYGVSPELLYRWRREAQKYERNSFPGHGKPKYTDQAALSIFEWIESWYNRRRRYSALGNKTIEEFEKINSNFKHAA